MRDMLLAGMVLLLVLAPGVGADEQAGQHEGRFHMLKQLPTEADAYQPPVAALVEQGIPEKYGEEEWAAVVFANEIHQHVGILTVVGAKMAVHARELLDAPPRTVKIVSETGPAPPQACALDGMQAAIGSTYGQQLIAAPPVAQPRVAAAFEYAGRTLRIALNPEYQARVAKYIADAIAAHGNLTEAYFEQIEENCYEVWAGFDRSEIFQVEELAHNPAD